MNINEMAKEAYKNAEEKGFLEAWNLIIDLRSEMKLDYKEYKSLRNNIIGNLLMEVTSEVAECHQALKKENSENFNEELADVVIRIGTIAELLGIDLAAEIANKIEINKDRPYLHGKSF